MADRAPLALPLGCVLLGTAGLGSRMAALFADAGLEDPISEWRGVEAISAAQRKRQGLPVDPRDTTISLINPSAPMA